MCVFSFLVSWLLLAPPPSHCSSCCPVFITCTLSVSRFPPPQPYYTNRPNLPPSSGPRGVPPSSAPRPVTPTHVYQPGSQMMVIPGPFPSSPQGPYFVQQQVRNQIVITFTLSVPSTAGAYYPAQQFPAGVQPTPVLINPGPQQQQPPPQPPQHMHTKRERKQIRIRDPNRGGRDITEEIMSGGRSGSTPTPPQVSQRCIKPVHYLYVSETFVISLYFKDDRGKPTPPPPSKTPELSEPTPISTEVAASETNNTVSVSEGVDTPLNCNATAAAPAPVSDVMDAPPPAPPREPSPPLQSAPEVPSYPAPLPDPVPSPNAQDEHKASESEEEEEEKMEEALEESAIPSSNGVVESEGLVVTMPSNHLEAPLESPIAQPEELRLPNGLPLPAPQDPNAPTLSAAERDDSPIAEPDLAQQSYNVPVSPLDSMRGCVIMVAADDLSFCLLLAAVSVPKKKRKMKDLNKKEAVGDLLDAFKEVVRLMSNYRDGVCSPEPATAPEPQAPAAPPTPEEADLTWEDKEDKLDAENIQPESVKPSDKKYQYKEEQWKPINMEEKKKYDRAFLLGFQFSSASMNKPVGLPAISDVVLDKANKTPLRQLDPSRLPGMNCGPDFTPSFANLGRPGMGGGGGVGGPRRSLQRKEPRKIITTMSLNDDIQLNKAEKAWKPTAKKTTRRGAEEVEENDPDQLKTQELFKRVRSILNKLTPQKFQQLMKQVTELTIDTEERLKGVIDLTFEKAISEPDFSVAYANMCRCLMGLKVPATDKPGTTVNFRKLLLNRCQKEFEKDKDDDEIFEKKQKELEAASNDEEKQRLTDELTDAKDKARRRSLGNIKFIGELFKLKMLTEVIMHDCIVKLLKNHDEESLECLCRLLSTIGKDLDFEKAKPRMDQYFTQMEKIIKEKKTSSRIRFMLQDVLDLRRSNWVPRRGDQGPKTIDQIHKEAEMEEQREQMKVQQALISKKDTGGRGQPPQDEGWNTVPISKNRPIDTSRLSKITKVPWNLCLEKEMYGSLLIKKHSSSRERGDRYERSDRGGDRFERRDDRDRNRLQVTKRSFSRETEERSREREQRGTNDPVRRVSSMTDDRGSRERAPTPPPPAPSKPALTEEELEKKSTAIIEEYLHINDMKEALQCVQELNSPQLLFVFVRNGLESTLERSTMGREHLGLLLHQLVKAGILSKPQYFKGLQEILEVADDMAIDIPHIWLYLAELITPMLHEGGIPMGELFREVAKPLIPLEKAGVLLVQILTLLCKGMSHKKAGAMWREAGLKWKDYLPEDEDVNKFVTEKNVEFTLGEESEKSQPSEMSSLELTNHLDRLIQDQADNQRIFDWIDANLDEKQTSSNMFVRALMTCICQSAIICENPYKVSVDVIKQRGKLLLKFLKDEQKELQALYALQALMVQMEQPANLLRMFFDALYDEDVIKEEAFYKWESSKDPAEQTGKGVALKSVTAFFTWLREAEDESDNS
uniref:Eukaryotic translation initiation factor 4 gamma 1 n=1 Tax=Neogobius melanostomus TaxID=47308 RepID=A0A8C6TQ52_9GOBI